MISDVITVIQSACMLDIDYWQREWRLGFISLKFW